MLRLQRLGKIKSPSYRLIVSEKTKDTQAGSLEILGQYDPTKQPKVIKFNTERIKYWLGKGAKASNTVNNLLINAGVITGKKMKSVYLSQARKDKMESKKAAKETGAQAEAKVAPESSATESPAAEVKQP